MLYADGSKARRGVTMHGSAAAALQTFFNCAASMSALAAGELAVGGDDGHAHR